MAFMTILILTIAKRGFRYFCPNGKFTCGDRTCISVAGRCNGVVDCPKDDLDERDCRRCNPKNKFWGLYL